MQSTRKALGVLSVLAMAAWLSASARAQDYQTVAFEGDNSAETAEIKAEVSELRNKLNATTQGGYEGGCGCGAPADAGCGCDAGCGGDACGDSCEDTCGTWGGFEPCCHSTGFWGEAELLWFKYHRADGARVGDAESDEEAQFAFEPTLRLTVGYVRCDGLGVRVRYWGFDHDADADEDNASLGVDTDTWDLEVFDTFALNRNWDAEVAFGVRYNDFVENLVDQPGRQRRINDFHGWGGVSSLELRRCVGSSGALFVRGRAAILNGEKDIRQDNLFGGNGLNIDQDVGLEDVTVGMTEIAFGYQYTVPICGGGYYFVKATVEWQNWYNFSSNFEELDEEDDFVGHSDVGFFGYGVSVGMAR